MTQDLLLRRKWTLRAYDRQIVLVKRVNESAEHVLLKAFLWALYLPEYPDLTVEVGIGARYKPDLVALDAQGRPRFWGEAGEVSVAKLRTLARRYPATHLALAKWDARLDTVLALVQAALAGARRAAPFDLLNFPLDSDERWIDAQGVIRITWAEVEHIRLEGTASGHD